MPHLFARPSPQEAARLNVRLALLLPLAAPLHYYIWHYSAKISDFFAYFAAAHLLRTAPSGLYNPTAILAFFHLLRPDITGDAVVGYLYPPPFALLLLPLGTLPYMAAYALWCALGVLCLLLGARWMEELAQAHGAQEWHSFFKTLALGLPVTFFAFLNGQVSLLLYALLAALLCALTRQRTLMAALALSIMLQIKPHLFLVLPAYLLGCRQWRLIGFTIVFWLLLAAASVLLLGAQAWPDYLHLLQQIYFQHLQVDADYAHMINLQGLFAGTIGADALRAPLTILYGLFAAFCLLWPLMRRTKSVDIGRLSLLMPLNFLLSPWLHIHDLLILLPACVPLAGALLARNRIAWMIPCYVMASYLVVLLPLEAYAWCFRAALLWLCGLSLYALAAPGDRRNAGAADLD